MNPPKNNNIKTLLPNGIYSTIDGGNLLLDSKRLNLIKELVDAGHVKAVLDRTFGFEEMAKAHRYVETGHKAGGVAVTVNQYKNMSRVLNNK